MNVLESVTDIFREEFENDSLVLTEFTTSANIRDWDSLANINIVVAMEKKFNIRFTSAEVQQLKNVGDMIKLIELKLSEK